MIQFSLDGGPYQISNTFSFISGGSHNIGIVDDNGCETFLNVTVNEPDELLLTATADSITCFDAQNGAIHFSATGGTQPYEFSLDGGLTFFSNSDTTQLLPAIYYPLVRDVNGCIAAVDSIKMANPPQLLITSVDYTDSLNCNGETTDITIHATGGTGMLFYSIDDGNTFGPDSIFPAQLPGTYYVVVRDIRGCTTYGDTLKIVEPQQITIDALKITNMLCAADSTGVIGVSASGGTGILQYSLDGGLTLQSDTAFTGLGADNYVLTVMDENGCSIDSVVSVTEPSPITMVFEDSTEITCHNADNGSITFVAAGGTGTLNYVLEPGTIASSKTDTGYFENLAPGVYQVMVTDDNGCGLTGNQITLENPSQIVIDSTKYADIKCGGINDGVITVYATGGTGTLQYSADGGANFFDNGGKFTDLGPGSFDIVVVDANGCMQAASSSITLTAPPAIQITSIDSTDITCNGQTDGAINISATGGSTGLIYSIDGGATFFNNGSFNSLPADTFNIVVQDSIGCFVTAGPVTLSEPDAIGITAGTTDILCAGDSSGIITATATGGTTPYSYYLYSGGSKIDSLTAGGPAVFDSLAAGTYTVTVADVNMCATISTGQLDVAQPLPFVYDSVLYTPYLCAAGQQGVISVYLSGGTKPYNYFLDGNSSADSTFSGLSGGTYTISAVDANGCAVMDSTLTIIQSAVINISAVEKTDIVACAGDSSGSIKIIASGGAGILNYSIDGGATFQTDSVFDSLKAGDYHIVVMDSLDCMVTYPDAVTLTEPTPISATFAVTNYINENALGTIAVIPAGGNPPYEYSYDNGTTFGQDSLFNNLIDSTYSVVVRDANGCEYHEDVTVGAEELLNGSTVVENVSCFGANDGTIILMVTDPKAQPPIKYTYKPGTDTLSNGNFTNLDAGTYYVYAIDAQGKVFADVIEITQPSPIQFSADVTDATCSDLAQGKISNVAVNGGSEPYNYTLFHNASQITDDGQGTFTGLYAGTYNMHVEDANSCAIDTTITISSEYTVKANAGKDDEVCRGANVILQGSSTIVPNPGNEDNILYSWSPINVTNKTATVSNINGSRDFILTVTEMLSGCYSTDTVRINTYAPEGLDILKDTLFSGADATWPIEVDAGNFTSFEWQPVTGLSDPAFMTPDLVVTETQLYTLTGTTPNGCKETDSLMVILVDDVKAYSGFTPNGDGINDTWIIQNADGYPEITVEIFNRWGERVFQSKGYDNSTKVFNGSRNGKDLPVGTYYYVIRKDPGSKAVTGNVTIVR